MFLNKSSIIVKTHKNLTNFNLLLITLVNSSKRCTNQIDFKTDFTSDLIENQQFLFLPC